MSSTAWTRRWKDIQTVGHLNDWLQAAHVVKGRLGGRKFVVDTDKKCHVSVNEMVEKLKELAAKEKDPIGIKLAVLHILKHDITPAVKDTCWLRKSRACADKKFDRRTELRSIVEALAAPLSPDVDDRPVLQFLVDLYQDVKRDVYPSGTTGKEGELAALHKKLQDALDDYRNKPRTADGHPHFDGLAAEALQVLLKCPNGGKRALGFIHKYCSEIVSKKGLQKGWTDPIGSALIHAFATKIKKNPDAAKGEFSLPTGLSEKECNNLRQLLNSLCYAARVRNLEDWKKAAVQCFTECSDDFVDAYLKDQWDTLKKDLPSIDPFPTTTPPSALSKIKDAFSKLADDEKNAFLNKHYKGRLAVLTQVLTGDDGGLIMTLCLPDMSKRLVRSHRREGSGKVEAALQYLKDNVKQPNLAELPQDNDVKLILAHALAFIPQRPQLKTFRDNLSQKITLYNTLEAVINRLIEQCNWEIPVQSISPQKREELIANAKNLGNEIRLGIKWIEGPTSENLARLKIILQKNDYLHFRTTIYEIIRAVGEWQKGVDSTAPAVAWMRVSPDALGLPVLEN